MKGKTAFISGASRGIGKAIALRLAEAGANIIIAAKTVEPHPRLEGTIYTAAEEIEKAGGRALPVQVDIRSEENVQEALEKGADYFGGIDILVNNASAINLSQTETMPMKRFDLVHSINVRGTYMVSKHAIPYLKKGNNAHILILSPPLNMDPKWFGMHLGYTISKYSMSMMAIGLAEELKDDKIAANALWPKTTIATAAVKNLLGGEDMMQMSRTPQIMADAAFAMLSKSSSSYTGQLLIDEDVLRAEGVVDFGDYAVNPEKDLMPDLFV